MDSGRKARLIMAARRLRVRGGSSRVGTLCAVNVRPNPPRMVTVLIALALLVVGLIGTLVDFATLRDFIIGLHIPSGIEADILRLLRDQTIAYVALFASPMLLVVGSLLPGI